MRRLLLPVALWVCFSPCECAPQTPAVDAPDAALALVTLVPDAAVPIAHALPPADAGRAPPSPRPATRKRAATPLPPNPFAAMCQTGCDRRPSQPEEPDLAPANTCPAGLCKRWVDISFKPDWMQVELQDAFLVLPGRVERWTGPTAFQVYLASGEVLRCTVQIGPATTGVDLLWGDEELEVQERPGSEPVPCDAEREGRFTSVGSKVEARPAVDAAVDAARKVLTEEQFNSDADLNVWLVQHQRIPPKTRYARTAPAARIRTGDAALFQPVNFSDLPSVTIRKREFCSPTWCGGRSRFSGKLRVDVSMAYLGVAADRICRTWRPLDPVLEDCIEAGECPTPELVWASNERLIAVQPSQEEGCDSSVAYEESLKRVPFSWPPRLDPSPGRDAELPTHVVEPWPLPERAQPSSLRQPDRMGTDLETLASFLAMVEQDPFLRFKALHDWVARNIVYDEEAHATHKYPPQDAVTVFTTRKGVCAGFANLLAAMGRAAGMEVAWIPGTSRGADGAVEAHAWNAVRINGRWYPVDATWDGSRKDGDSTHVETEWLFTPPEMFRASHHPDDGAWQLTPDAESSEAFLSRPLLARGYVALDVRARVVELKTDTFRFHLAVPTAAATVAVRRSDASTWVPCELHGERTVEVTCPTGAPGKYVVEIGQDGAGPGRLAGQLEILRR